MFICPDGITSNSSLTGPNNTIYINIYIYIYIYVYILVKDVFVFRYEGIHIFPNCINTVIFINK